MSGIGFSQCSGMACKGCSESSKKSGLCLEYGRMLDQADWNEEIFSTTFEGSFYVKEVVFS